MLRHVAKRQRREVISDESSSESDENLENGEEQGEEFLGFGEVEEQVSDDAGEVVEQDPLQKPIIEDESGLLRCVLCPLKRLKSDGDAVTHTESQGHHRRRERIVTFLKTDEAKPFIEQDDILGIVRLLDERQIWVPPEERPPKKKKPRVGKPGKRQRAEIRERKIAEAAAQANGATSNGLNGKHYDSDSS